MAIPDTFVINATKKGGIYFGSWRIRQVEKEKREKRTDVIYGFSLIKRTFYHSTHPDRDNYY